MKHATKLCDGSAVLTHFELGLKISSHSSHYLERGNDKRFIHFSQA